MMVAGIFLLRWDCRELSDGCLLEDFVGDFLGIRPFCLAGLLLSCFSVLVAATFFLVRLRSLLLCAFIVRLGRRFFTRVFGAGVLILRLLSFSRFTLWQEIDMQRLRQFGGADICTGFDIEDLLGLALFIANDAAVDRLDLEGGFL